MVQGRIVAKVDNSGRIAARFPEAVQAGLQNAANRTLQRSRPLTPFRTGHLRNAVQMQSGPTSARVTWAAPYAAYQEYGTRRGIRPKRFAQTSAEAEEKNLVAYMAALESQL